MHELGRLLDVRKRLKDELRLFSAALETKQSQQARLPALLGKPNSDRSELSDIRYHRSLSPTAGAHHDSRCEAHFDPHRETICDAGMDHSILEEPTTAGSNHSQRQKSAQASDHSPPLSDRAGVGRRKRILVELENMNLSQAQQDPNHFMMDGLTSKLPRRSALGQMVSHLAKARAEENELGRRWRCQKERLDAVELKEKKAKWKVLESEIRELEGRIAERAEDLKELEDRISIMSESNVIEQVAKQWSIMENFIRTNSEPCLFWMPYRHNSQTRRLQNDTRHEIKQKLKNLKPSTRVCTP